MKFLFSVLFLLFINIVFAQLKNHQQEILSFQKELNESYRNPKETPLDSVALKNFQGHSFFPIDAQYRVKAKFKRTPNQKPFEMPTSSGKTKTYEKYGELHFTLKGKKEKLNVYQSHALREKAEYKDYLFLPFLDLTNGVSSYGAGRYLDMRIPKNHQWVIDFNKAYNAYCAYSPNYSCPIVPMENFLDTEVEAGIRYVNEKEDKEKEITEVKNFQKLQNEKYRDSIKTPLKKEDLPKFTEHSFFPINLKYRIKAKHILTPNEKPFEMMTSTGKTFTHIKTGEAHFSWQGKPIKLNLYQSFYFREQPEYKGLLFLPYKDKTNTVTTYGAGRYVYVKDYTDTEIILDFNQSFNPLCAYNEKYNCPVVPEENILDFEILAGMKYVPIKE